MKNAHLLMIALLATGCVGKKKYLAAMDELQANQSRVSDLESELAASRGEEAELRAGQAELESDLARQERALRELRAREAVAQARVAAYQDLVSRFQEMIDAGNLKVRFVDGRMIVEMNTDILFASGEAKLSDEGRSQLAQVANILSGIPDRKYQIEGHTDDKPIKTARFPSNWELASARANAAVKEMIDAGLAPERVSAASFAEYRPAYSNGTDEGRAQNRRIEIVVLPDLNRLPGADEIRAIADAEVD